MTQPDYRKMAEEFLEELHGAPIPEDRYQNYYVNVEGILELMQRFASEARASAIEECANLAENLACSFENEHKNIDYSSGKKIALAIRAIADSKNLVHPKDIRALGGKA